MDVTAAYLTYVAHCDAEQLQPLTHAGWRIASSPLTTASMRAACAWMWRCGLDESERAIMGRLDVSSQAWRSQREFRVAA